MIRLFNKAYANSDVLTGASISATLVSTPVWLSALTDWLQLVAVIVGITVGWSAYKLNTARRRALDD